MFKENEVYIGSPLDEQSLKQFYSKELLHWYRAQKRSLPWRENKDPYRIWVSEIMLQQTKVDTVIPYFQRFMERFPTVQQLAVAEEEEVLKCWEGLGYYSRARNLHTGAKMVVEHFGGVVPNDKTEVASLKGVGPYTTGAIMSIAFNEPVPAVDGNVMRVLSRFFLLQDDIAKQKTRVSIEHLAVSLIPEGEAGDFNQALMELGALVCTPKAPVCLTCPVMEHCAARLNGMELQLPIKTKAKPPRSEWRGVVIVEGSGEQTGKILVRQRPETGLLAQMWELPHLLLPEEKGKQWFQETATKKEPQLARLLGEMLVEEQQLIIRPTQWLMDIDHIFSHIHWKMRVYIADTSTANDWMQSDRVAETANSIAEESLPDQQSGYTTSITVKEELADMYRWIGKQDLEQLPFPNVFVRILQQYWSE
ncbi:A/G-specific adenine glycosylase [Paenibacillus yanchengensis]|uniref:Adenine DNA glycosylase n=1 Tax=Paenibacillus yanchengensis TaxID=2035833 RepID=A0ABW4YIV0_9BACL